MAGKKSEFDKVFSAWDILVIAFGAMIGWGWVDIILLLFVEFCRFWIYTIHMCH